jgi:predicted unusual protein kinase regulating ubiquinone biosynthesis (AarF/ABC1/UbiB family)
MTVKTATPVPLDRRRYRRVGRFFLRLFLHVLFWDVFLARPWLERFRSPPLPRWRRLAAEYRVFAVEMGGVLIKLGQFLATRVDVLPGEITAELAGLQDEVPAAPFDQVLAQIEADLGVPLGDRFAGVLPVPIGAASLAQVHRATLLGGQEVVVKALRPGIAALVETDLAAVGVSVRRLNRVKAIRRQVDLDWLVRELTSVTRKELDLRAEGRNAERFAADFAADPEVHVPRIYWSHSGPRTLTMEDVSAIRVDDVAALGAAGIAPARVAAKLFDCYLEQVLITHFVHADPHAGNLFVKPLPARPAPPANGSVRGGAAIGPAPAPGREAGERRPAAERPFRLVFVDFGMAVTIPARLHAALRHYVIGVATRNPGLIMEAYLEAGVLLPGADLRQVEELTSRLLDRFTGTFLAQVKDADVAAYGAILQDYRSLLYSAPFQFQADLLFVFRAMGILSGMVARLDPDLDPVSRTMPFARRLIREEYLPDSDDLIRTVSSLLRLPARLDDLLARAQRGRLEVTADLAPAPARRVASLERAVNRLTWLVAGTGLLTAGVLARTAGWTDAVSVALLVGAAVALGGALLRA